MIYKLIRFYSTRELETEVNMLIKDGWQLQGGVTAATEFSLYNASPITTYTQALTKEENTVDKRK